MDNIEFVIVQYCIFGNSVCIHWTLLVSWLAGRLEVTVLWESGGREQFLVDGFTRNVSAEVPFEKNEEEWT